MRTSFVRRLVLASATAGFLGVTGPHTSMVQSYCPGQVAVRTA